MTMRFSKTLLLALSFLSSYHYAQAQQNELSLNNLVDTFSYAVGMNLAQNMKDQGIKEVNGPALLQAMQEVFNGKATLIDNETANMKIQEAIQAFMAQKVKDAQEKENSFFAENAKKKGVVSLPNGLQYKVLKAGSGKNKPKLEDTVVVNYIGTLTNGNEFDNSFKRGQPATFPLGGVIKGWTEILQLMPVGSSWEVYIPFAMAYGERAMGPNLPAYSTLIFQIDLLDIKPALEDKK